MACLQYPNSVFLNQTLSSPANKPRGLTPPFLACSRAEQVRQSGHSMPAQVQPSANPSSNL
eukprot:3042665-Prorocentrum_lima.AAC.1